MQKGQECRARVKRQPRCKHETDTKVLQYAPRPHFGVEQGADEDSWC